MNLRRHAASIGAGRLAGIGALWVGCALAWALASGRIRVRTLGGVRSRWAWPWLHWCVFDPECRAEGCPARVYVHLLGIYVDVGDPEGQ